MVKGEHIVLFKLPNKYKNLPGLCEHLAHRLDRHQLESLYDFMAYYVNGSKSNAEMSSKLEKDEKLWKKQENEKIDLEAAKELIFMFMSDGIFLGPIAITRALGNHAVHGRIDAICDPITASLRATFDASFCKKHIGNLVMIDVDNIFILPCDDVLEMHFPRKDVYFEFIGIHAEDRVVNVIPIEESWPIKDVEILPRNEEVKVVLQKVDGLQHCIRSWKFESDAWNSVDNKIMYDICTSEEFIDHYKGKGITICYGYKIADMVSDTLEMQCKIEALEARIQEFENPNKEDVQPEPEIEW